MRTSLERFQTNICLGPGHPAPPSGGDDVNLYDNLSKYNVTSFGVACCASIFSVHRSGFVSAGTEAHLKKCHRLGGNSPIEDTIALH